MIQAATLNFLEGVAENNEREWFQAHKDDYEQARANVLELTAQIIQGVTLFDPEVPAGLEAKNCVMRIYRDVRFSKNKAPYKTNFGVGISANGKSFNGPGYYLHIQPGKAFVAAGSWMPEPAQLKAIRQEIDYNASDFREIVEHADFKKAVGDLSFEDQLKTLPKGYAADHPMIRYLKLKSFIAETDLSDSLLTGPKAAEKIVKLFETMYPLMAFLRNAIGS